MGRFEVIIFGLVLPFFNVECSQPNATCLVYDVETMTIVKNYDMKVKVDCSVRGFTTVPVSLPIRTSMLDIHGNNLSRLESNGFKHVKDVVDINLSNNGLAFIEADAFVGLFRLEILNLAGNRLCLPISYPEGVFKDLTALKVLKTFSNDCTRHRSIPDDVFSDLVSLEKISLDATQNFTFGTGFKFLKNLTHVEASSRLDKCYDYAIRITDHSLVGLQGNKLTHLALRGCAFRHIDTQALNGLPFLETLNFACASGLAETLFRAIRDMSSDTVRTLVLDGTEIFPKTFLINSIGNTHFCHQKFRNLERLSLRGTKLLAKLILSENGTACTPHLHHLNLGNNPLFNILGYSLNPRRVLEHGVPTSAYWSLTNIRTVDVSDLYGQMFAVENKFCARQEQEIEEYFRKPPKIVELPTLENFDVTSGNIKSNLEPNLSKAVLYNAVVGFCIVSPGTQIVFADSVYAGQTWDFSAFKRCPCIVYPFDTVSYINVTKNNAMLLNCPAVGIRSLKVLDASFCYLKSIHVDTLKQKYTPNLEILYAKGNQWNSTHDFPEIFSEATSLKELDISNNYLHSLPEDSFENLTSIQKLYLSENVLKTIELKISNLKKLNVLDLSSNQIPFLSKTFQEQLEAVASHNANFRLRLGGNPFLCDCTSIHFLQWLPRTNVTVDNRETFQCVNTATLLVDVDIKQLLEGCENSSHYAAIGIMGSVVAVAIVGIFVTYKKRWKIAWHMYSLKRRLFKSNHNEVEMDRKYDAFVAYHIEHETNDYGVTWVVNELKGQVEDHWDKLLFIFDRNANPGGTKISEIIYGIQQSRKVLFVLTENYIKSGLWEMVLYWAVRQGLNNVIMCCLGDMNIDKFPPSLAKVAIELQERYPTHYLEFPLQSTCTGGSESAMWSNLRLALGT